ncbi:PLP-dependent transferase [Roseimarinus sediminis]|jgi:O-acetylhomoserine (thiol)-lyase|uniref:PLP-dependent transferase n=1 Tax=Roseimarinus sediminis TaxID=1610899 RepID=UPI003D23CE5B
MSKKSFTTRSLNIAFPSNDPYRALHMPIYESVAFEFERAEDIAANFRGELPAHVYSRTGNPTVLYLEKKIRELSGAHQVLAVSSGMAAISNSLLNLCEAGDNIIAGNRLFGHTYALFNETLPKIGISTRFANLEDEASIEALIDDKTRLIYFETVTNPQLEIPNIGLLKKLAVKHQLVLMADSTLTPPVTFDARAAGIDIEVMSTTKFISGGATSIGGIIVDYGSYNWNNHPHLSAYVPKLQKDTFFARLKKNIFRNTGACMTAHSAYFQLLGLDLLELRVERCVNNCLELGAYLEKHSSVVSVNYPALPSSPFYERSGQYFNHQPGAILTFDLESEAACFEFMNRLRIVRRATNLNDNKSLIIHPWSTIYVEFPAAERLSMGIRPGMMRLSVGIEGISDLIDDIEQALN